MKTEYSLILPCFNESGALGYLFQEYGELASSLQGKLEVIFVNNGSADDTESQYKKLLLAHPQYTGYFVYHHEEINRGVGGGLKAGAKIAQGKYLILCHADEQYGRTAVSSALKKFEELDISEKERSLVKGIRSQRAWRDFLISRAFDVVAFLIKRALFYDINAQPKIFMAPKKEFWEKAPNDYCIDIFLLLSLSRDHEVLSVKVPLQERQSGKSSWGRNWSSVFRLAKVYVRFLINFSQT